MSAVFLAVAFAIVWTVYKITSAPVVDVCATDDCGCQHGSLDHRGEAR